MEEVPTILKREILRYKPVHATEDLQSTAWSTKGAGTADEDRPQPHALSNCLAHQERIGQTMEFRQRNRQSILALREVVAVEGWVFSGDELRRQIPFIGTFPIFRERGNISMRPNKEVVDM